MLILDWAKYEYLPNKESMFMKYVYTHNIHIYMIHLNSCVSKVGNYFIKKISMCCFLVLQTNIEVIGYRSQVGYFY